MQLIQWLLHQVQATIGVLVVQIDQKVRRHQPAMPQKRLLNLLCLFALGVCSFASAFSILKLDDVVELPRFWRCFTVSASLAASRGFAESERAVWASSSCSLSDGSKAGINGVGADECFDDLASIAAVVSTDSSSSVMSLCATSMTPRPDAVVLVVSARRPLGRLEWIMTVLVDSARGLLVVTRLLALLDKDRSSDPDPSTLADAVERRLRALAEPNRRAILPLLRGALSLVAGANDISVGDLTGELSFKDGDRIMESS